MTFLPPLADSDEELLSFLTGPVAPHKLAAAAQLEPQSQQTATTTPRKVLPRRDAALDPLLIAAAAASGPHITRNHYHHDFFPGVMLPRCEGSWDWTTFQGETKGSVTGTNNTGAGPRYRYVSKQAPRSERMLRDGSASTHSPSVAATAPHRTLEIPSHIPPTSSTRPVRTVPITPNAPLQVRCMARTRVPTPHGTVFLHLYHNNQDDKEHLAVVVDPAQLLPESDTVVKNLAKLKELGVADQRGNLKSQSLEQSWSEDETIVDRVVRGASPNIQPTTSPSSSHSQSVIPPPLIRIHSECFTGETIGSMRCDCGEQLDQALRAIFEPVQVRVSVPSESEPLDLVIPPLGVVVYLRQEGRGIGLLSKIRAYNIQDLGYDTLEANEMMGFQGDARGYGVVGAVLRDLGMAPGSPSQTATSSDPSVRLLTNNPLKVAALEKEGVKVVERVEMVPKSWNGRLDSTLSSDKKLDLLPVHSNGHSSALPNGHAAPSQSRPSLLPSSFTQREPSVVLHRPYGPDLEKYLRTKVEKMGHVLPLPLSDEALSYERDRGITIVRHGER